MHADPASSLRPHGPPEHAHHLRRRRSGERLACNATGDEFRSAPLWGVGQRVFFLHDGRTTDLLQAIEAHASAGDGHFAASEANDVINQFNQRNVADKQAILDFLRSL